MSMQHITISAALASRSPRQSARRLLRHVVTQSLALAAVCAALPAQWTSLPLPPGVTQIGSGGSQMQPAGSSPLCTTNFGANLYELSGGTWSALPLPPGVTQIGSSGSQLQPAGTSPLCTTNFGANLYEFSGVTWNALPLPP
ncbi:MAG: hypothetical protein ACI9SE_002440, partial [Neolewinella sp.]